MCASRRLAVACYHQVVLPQGGGLSPLLWSLVADSLLKWLSKQGVFTQGFADDGVIIIVGKVLHILSDIMQRMMRGVLALY